MFGIDKDFQNLMEQLYGPLNKDKEPPDTIEIGGVKYQKVKNPEPKTLTDLIERWWCDVFTTHSDWDMETSIDDLVDRIQLWLPKEQSAKGSQNAYVECSVDGFNDCLNKIKDNLR